MHLVVIMHTVTQSEDHGWLLRLVLAAWLQWPGCHASIPWLINGILQQVDRKLLWLALVLCVDCKGKHYLT